MPHHTDGSGEPVGARAVDVQGAKRGGPVWLVPLAVVVLILLVIPLILTRCGGEDAGSQPATSVAPTRTPVARTPAPTPSPSLGQGMGGTPGTITVDSTTILPLSGDTDARLNVADGQAATATAVDVQSVPADEGFWAGTGDSDRVWVQLTGRAGESPYKVSSGDTVTFTGRVARNSSGFADRAGVSATEGRAQLLGQEFHIDVEKSALMRAE